MRNPLRWAEERPAASLALLVAAAFSLRLAFGFWTGPLPPVLSDAQYYDAAARSLVSGAGYSVGIDASGFTPGGSPTAFFPPGYPSFLAGVYRLFGHSLDAARVANCAAAALSIVPVYLAGRVLFGRREGLLAAAGTAVSPSLVFWTPVLVSESLFLLPFLLAVALMLAVGFGGGRWPPLALATGVAVGVAGLVRGQGLVLLPVAAVLWLRALPASRALPAAALAAVSAALVLLPWSLRSSLEFDSVVLLSTNFGYNLRVGHAPYSNGCFVVPEDLEAFWREPGATYHSLEPRFNREGTSRALSYALAHPLRELELSARKVSCLWRPSTDALIWVQSFGLTPLGDDWARALEGLLEAAHWATVAGAGLAVLLSRRARSAGMPLVLVVVFWTLAHVAFFGQPRYLLPVVPLLILMCTAALPPAPGPAKPPGAEA